jgi:hypothetical protein
VNGAMRTCYSWGLVLSVSVGLAGCGSSSRPSSSSGPATTGSNAPRASSAAKLVHWQRYIHVPGVLDLVGPRPDGALVVAAAGKLRLLHRSGAVTRYAPRYSSPGGGEPYIALAPASRRRCNFSPGTVYALRLVPPRGVTAITPRGRVRQFARLTAPGLLNGITFDTTGRFGHRLLVTANAGASTTVEAIDCHGRVSAITRQAPRMEGGVAVAPVGFGRFAGDLIAPDELGGTIVAITPHGTALTLANSGLPHGPDTGVEGLGFAPRGRVAALFADRLTPGNPHPGDDVVLSLGPAALRTAGVRSGELLVASEGGAATDAIRCTSSGCRVRHVANGPPETHGEGHVAFVPAD